MWSTPQHCSTAYNVLSYVPLSVNPRLGHATYETSDKFYKNNILLLYMEYFLATHDREGDKVGAAERKRNKCQGGVWVSCRLVFDTAGRRGSEAVCGLHAASSLMPREGGETRRHVDSHATSSSTTRERGETSRHVDSMTPRLRHCGKEGKRGGMWPARRLVFDAAERRKRRQRVVSTSRRRCPRKDGKRRGSVWFPRCLVIDAAGRGGNDEAACGFHATPPGSGLLPGPGCSPRPDSSPLFPSSFTFPNYWLLSSLG